VGLLCRFRLSMITLKKQVFLILEYSRNHFATAQGTPYMVKPLQHLLQYDGLTPFGTRVLQGRAHIDDLPLDEPTKALLTHLQSKHPDDDARHPLVYDEIQDGIKNGQKTPQHRLQGATLGSINHSNGMSSTRMIRRNNQCKTLFH